MIDLDAYFMGRRQPYRAELTDAIERHAFITVERVSMLLNEFCAANPGAATRWVTSGWRPASLNARIAGAAKNSLHITGEAVDLSDDDSALDDWINTPAGIQVMTTIELWAEKPKWTPRWCHLQIRPPRSGLRFFQP